MAITRVQLLSIPVGDQDRALAFYRDALGFILVNDMQIAPDQRWVMLSPPGRGTAITLVTWFPSMPAGSLRGLVLETDDLDSDVAALHAQGVETSDIEDQPWGRFVTFDDPDGNGLVLQASTAS